MTDEDLVDLYQDDWQRYLVTDGSKPDSSHEPPFPPSIRESESDANAEAESETVATIRESGEIEVSEKVDRLLKDIASHPFKPASQRYELFSSTGKGYQIKNEAETAGLIEEVEVADSGTTRKLFEFTDRGLDYLEKLDVEIRRDGRGGVVHRYWQHRIKEMLEEAGYAAGVEKMDIDVYGNTGKTEVAVEVAMGKNQREVDHIRDRLSRGLQVVVACIDRDIIEYLKTKASDEGIELENVDFQQFQDLSARYFESL